MDKKVIITKVDDTPVKAGKKTVKTFPKSILKKTAKIALKGVKDPAKAPPLKKGMKKHTLRLLTEKGMRKHRKTMKNRLAKMSDSTVKDVVQKSGLVVNPHTPSNVSRPILDNALSAGFVSM
jgi:hypothetical protein